MWDKEISLQKFSWLLKERDACAGWIQLLKDSGSVIRFLGLWSERHQHKIQFLYPSDMGEKGFWKTPVLFIIVFLRPTKQLRSIYWSPRTELDPGTPEMEKCGLCSQGALWGERCASGQWQCHMIRAQMDAWVPGLEAHNGRCCASFDVGESSRASQRRKAYEEREFARWTKKEDVAGRWTKCWARPVQQDQWGCVWK